MVTWLLVHSPPVGPVIWNPVAAELRQRGQEAIIPDLTPALIGGGSHAQLQAELVAAAVGQGPVALVAHSGAGPLLPLIAHRLEQQNVAVVASLFVDACCRIPDSRRLTCCLSLQPSSCEGSPSRVGCRHGPSGGPRGNFE